MKYEYVGRIAEGSRGKYGITIFKEKVKRKMRWSEGREKEGEGAEGKLNRKGKAENREKEVRST